MQQKSEESQWSPNLRMRSARFRVVTVTPHSSYDIIGPLAISLHVKVFDRGSKRVNNQGKEGNVFVLSIYTDSIWEANSQLLLLT